MTAVGEQKNVKGKSRYKANDVLPEDENMDFVIEDEVHAFSFVFFHFIELHSFTFDALREAVFWMNRQVSEKQYGKMTTF